MSVAHSNDPPPGMIFLISYFSFIVTKYLTGSSGEVRFLLICSLSGYSALWLAEKAWQQERDHADCQPGSRVTRMWDGAVKP